MKFNFAKLTSSFTRTLLSALVLVSIVAGTSQAQSSDSDKDRDRYSDSDNSNGEVYALTTGNVLISFRQNKPGQIIRRFAVKNLRAGESLLGIDFRPANGRLYGVGSSNQIYTINRYNGVATQVGAPFTPALESAVVGFDFNPAVDRIRVITETGQNLRLHPDFGTVVDADPNTPGVQADGRLNYAGSTATGVVGAAYSNPDNDPNTPTVLYDIDTNRDFLVRQDPPNAGALVDIGSLGVDTSNLVGFDIGFNGSKGNDGNSDGLAALQVGGVSQLYRIDITSGRAQLRGQIGNGEVISGLAIVLPAPRYNNDGTYQLGNSKNQK